MAASSPRLKLDQAPEDSFSFSEIPEETISDMIMAVCAERRDAVTVMCTNLRAARLASELEEMTGIPVIDSTAATVWAGMRLAGNFPDRIQGWGQLFACRPVSDR